MYPETLTTIFYENGEILAPALATPATPVDVIESAVAAERSSSSSSEEDEFWLQHCSVIEPERLRLFLVAVAGTSVAALSLLFNAFLCYVLAYKRQNRRTHLLYLTFMAFIDVFLSVSYILLFPVNLFMDFYGSDFLATIWWNLLRPMYALCHIAITASALLLTAATFERYLTISKIRSRFSTSYRLIISSAALFFALAAKGPMFFELKVIKNANCTGVTEYAPMMEPWTEEEPYKTWYKFFFRSVVSTFLPFFLSFYFNVRIVIRLNRQHMAARLFRFATSEHRKNIRSATRMLVLVTCCYIVCNLLNVIVTAWEMVDMDTLLSENIRPYYTYTTDTVSLLTVVACGVRLPIYYACNARIRREVNAQLSFVLRIFYCFLSASFIRKVHKLSRDNFSFATMRYFNTGNGFIVYSSPSSPSSSRSSIRNNDRIKSPTHKLNTPNTSPKLLNRIRRHDSTRTTRSEPAEDSEKSKLLVVGTGLDKAVLHLAVRMWRTNSRRSQIL